MKIVSARRPGSKVIGRVQGISRLAKARLKWLDHYRGHGENAALNLSLLRYQPPDVLQVEATVQSRGISRAWKRGAIGRGTLRQPHLVSGAGSSSVTPEGAVPKVGERQACSAATGARMAGLHLYGGANPELPEGPWRAQGGTPQWYLHS